MFCSGLALNRCFIYKPILFLIPDSVDVYLTAPALWQLPNRRLTEKVKKKKKPPTHTARSFQSPVSLPSDDTVFPDGASAVLRPGSRSHGRRFRPGRINREIDMGLHGNKRGRGNQGRFGEPMRDGRDTVVGETLASRILKSATSEKKKKKTKNI